MIFLLEKWTMAGNFVGRQALLTRILKADTKEGQAGRFFVVPGVPGSGKTEFLNQLKRAVEKAEGSPGGKVIHVRCSSYEAAGSRRATQAFDEAVEFRQFKALLQDSFPLAELRTTLRPRGGNFESRVPALRVPLLEGSARVVSGQAMAAASA